MSHCPRCGLSEGIAGHCPHHGWHSVPADAKRRLTASDALDGMRNELQRVTRRMDLLESTMQDCVSVLKELKGD